MSNNYGFSQKWKDMYPQCPSVNASVQLPSAAWRSMLIPFSCSQLISWFGCRFFFSFCIHAIWALHEDSSSPSTQGGAQFTIPLRTTALSFAAFYAHLHSFFFSQEQWDHSLVSELIFNLISKISIPNFLKKYDIFNTQW